MLTRKFPCVVGVLLLSMTLAPNLWAADPEELSQAGEARKSAEVHGFRSALFGMNEKQVMAAIASDFKIAKKKVKREVNPLEKTTALAIDVKDLVEASGLTRIVYTLGYKSKKLIQVNIFWGTPINPKPNAEALVNTANLLRNHLAQKGFQKDDLIMNARLTDGSVLVFRGKDAKGKEVMLLLNISNDSEKNKKQAEEPRQASLTLIYRENPLSPDIFKLKKSDF